MYRTKFLKIPKRTSSVFPKLIFSISFFFFFNDDERTRDKAKISASDAKKTIRMNFRRNVRKTKR